MFLYEDKFKVYMKENLLQSQKQESVTEKLLETYQAFCEISKIDNPSE